MTALVYDILWALAAVAWLLARWAGAQASSGGGYDRAMGLGFTSAGLGLLSGCLTACLLWGGILNGRFDWTGVARWLQFLVSSGLLILLAVSLFGSLDGGFLLWPQAWNAAPLVIFLGCLMAIHGNQWWGGARGSTLTVVVLLGSMAVAGWGVVAVSYIQHVEGQMESARRAAREEDDRQRAQSAEEAQQAEAYRALPPNASLAQVLPFSFSRNPAVSQEANARIAGWPNRDEVLGRLIRQDERCALAFVAFGSPTPDTRWAPAWSALLDHKREQLEREADGSSSLKTNDLQLSIYGMGAQRLLEAGAADIKAPLQRWSEFLDHWHVG